MVEKGMAFKLIFISGGVISGLGKGVTAAALGSLLKDHNYKVSCMKCDMYLNIDAGTMNPIEHGEVFVTADGVETDQDLGHYERFLNETLGGSNYVTRGQLYKDILKKERELAYDGKCVEDLFEIPKEFERKIYAVYEKTKCDILIVELGGTVGEYQGAFIYEAVRKLKLKFPKNIVLIHVGYLPAPSFLGELKSKPLQASVIELFRLGLQPDFIVCRGEKPIDDKRMCKISDATGVPFECIIDNPDIESIYDLPLYFKDQNFDIKVLEKLHLAPHQKAKPIFWLEYKLLRGKSHHGRKVRIGIVGKYQKTGNYMLADSYICVVESIKHACAKLCAKAEIVWVDAQSLEDGQIHKELENLDGIIVPQGWGSRGSEGKLKAIEYARTNKISYLGLCFGMQHLVIEFARNVCGLKDANSKEVDPKTKHPVVHIMPNQKELLKNHQYGGTIRLGQWPCKVKDGTLLYNLYSSYTNYPSKVLGAKGPDLVYERHRHRYEFNNNYKKVLEENGLVVCGTSPNGKIVEAVELKRDLHPFFLGVQFHPEYQSRPMEPHPLFVGFVKSCLG